ncbi:MAG: cysteine--tRNA ligase [Anaerotignum sp.]|nr:cysteine--tRNA ligase [Anaerotignum sp.]
MKVYNTLTRKKEEFVPMEEGKVKMYVCGPTVYDYIHIGNARPYVVFDTVRRYLEYKGYEVTYVQNFTDVDDKIINRANKENSSMQEISDRYIEEAFRDADGLNVRRATIHPRVTQEMDGIVEMIQTLVDKGFAYADNGTVYYNTKMFPEYGKLSRKNLDELIAGGSERVAVDDAKKNPTDFVLWKPKKEGEPSWSSPWGDGRPGWHIECSVMARHHLGETIDIHAGGEDLIFPHHENEIAQSEAANGKPFARYWLHNGFITVDNEKMSKSLGNFFTVRDIAAQFPYEVIRFFILNGHYRSPINFSRELMQACQNGLERIKNARKELDFYIKNAQDTKMTAEEKTRSAELGNYKAQFEEAMDDDFNTADAVSVIYELVRFSNIAVKAGVSKEYALMIQDMLDHLCGVLGIAEVQEDTVSDEDVAKIEALIAQRTEAKQAKDFAKADAIRDELAAMGVTIKDTRQGVQWSKE